MPWTVAFCPWVSIFRSWATIELPFFCSAHTTCSFCTDAQRSWRMLRKVVVLIIGLSFTIVCHLTLIFFPSCSWLSCFAGLWPIITLYLIFVSHDSLSCICSSVCPFLSRCWSLERLKSTALNSWLIFPCFPLYPVIWGRQVPNAVLSHGKFSIPHM